MKFIGLLGCRGHRGSEREGVRAVGRERSAMQTRTPTEPKNLRSHGSFVSFTMKVEAERKTELPTDSVV